MKLFRQLCLLILLAALFILPLAAHAAPTPVIRDDADLLTDEEEKQLYTVMESICEYGTPMFWSTTKSGNDQQLVDDFYYIELGVSSGTLLVINMNSRIITLKSNGAISRTVTNADADTITDNIFRFARAGRYYECASSAFEQVGRMLRGERIARPMKIVSNVLLAVTLAMMIVYFYISKRYEQHTTTRKIKAAVPVSVMSAAAFSSVINNTQKKMIKQVKTDISSSSGSGSGRSGGGFSGGGFSGGHSSGSSGSHRF